MNTVENRLIMTKTKNTKLSASLEDYIEAIFNLAGKDKTVRSTDIAKRLKVSKASVTGALRLLKERKLVNYKPYGLVTLTSPGRKAAADVARKHNILKSFMVNLLYVDLDTAQEAACRAEHTLGSDVIGKILAFIEFVTTGSRNGYDVAKEFKKFCKNKNIKTKMNA